MNDDKRSEVSEMDYEKERDAAADKFCGGVNLLTGSEHWISGENCFKAGSDFGAAYERKRAEKLVEAIKQANWHEHVQGGYALSDKDAKRIIESVSAYAEGIEGEK